MTPRPLIAAITVGFGALLCGCAAQPAAVATRGRTTRTAIPLPTEPPRVNSSGPDEVRPLFRPLVRTLPRAEVGATVSRPPARLVKPPLPEASANAAPPLAPEPELYYVGVTVLGGETRALIEERDRSQGHRVREGETVGDYRVTRITGETVELARGERTLTLTLGEGKATPGLQPLGAAMPEGGDDPNAAALAALPAPVRSTLSRVMPLTGELRRVRTDRDNGRMVYRIERRMDGLDWEIRVGPQGEIVRIEQDLRIAAIPEPVLRAANAYREGYRVNPDDTPRLLDRGGERYYELEVRQVGGRDEVDLRIAPSGHILGRG